MVCRREGFKGRLKEFLQLLNYFIINLRMKNILLLIVFIFCSSVSIANITLPRIFGNNMVLQRNKPITIWGWADAGEKVTVQFNKQIKKTKAGKDGSWKIELNQESA